MHPKYELGVAEIDSQHRELDALVAELRNVLATPERRALVRPALKRLHQLLINHFDYEESLMQMVAYSDYAHHKRMHSGVLKLFRDCLEQEPEEDSFEQMGKLIGDKVLGHIMDHDIPLADAIRKHLAQNAVRSA